MRSVFERTEIAFDGAFGGADNPLRHLGALGLYFLWILVVSGLYLYTVLDTSIDGVSNSIGWLTREQWYLGGVMRSLHRYASDAFVLVMFLHLLREWAYGRYHGFRLYSWVTGVPLIWLVFISGIGGYWIVWDRLAQFSAVATTDCITAGAPAVFGAAGAAFSVNWTRALISGFKSLSLSRIVTFTCTVALVRSAVGITCRTRPLYLRSGNASAETSAG